MSSETEKQLNGFVVKQKAMIATEKEEIRQALLLGAWSGFLNGLKLTRAITNTEYNKYYDEIQEFAGRINKHEEIKKSCSNIVTTGYEFKGRCQAR